MNKQLRYNISMNLSIAIVGLPNVGKSTLFNALLKRQVAEAANYPFCTIEPNVGVVEVPDARLEKLADIVAQTEMGSDRRDPSTGLRTNRPPVIPAAVRFVDIAGLVKGASTGEGLGNQFLANIRECQMILEVVRAFTDENVIRAGALDPESDIATIKTELILKDIESLRKTGDGKQKTDGRGQKTEDRDGTVKKLLEGLNQGKAASEVELTDEAREAVRDLQLLTAKPIVYVYNVDESDVGAHHDAPVTESIFRGIHESPLQSQMVVVSAKVEAELSSLAPEEQQEYLSQLGLAESGLDRVIRVCYQTLGLQTYFTAGPKEVRAWTIQKGAKAPEAAGAIHTDFERGFIAAEVCHYQDYIDCGGWSPAREKGKVRLEGKEYVMQDGDVVEFRFSV